MTPDAPIHPTRLRLSRGRVWRQVVRWIGGVHELGRALLCVHDHGMLFAWDDVVRWELRLANRTGEG